MAAHPDLPVLMQGSSPPPQPPIRFHSGGTPELVGMSTTGNAIYSSGRAEMFHTGFIRATDWHSMSVSFSARSIGAHLSHLYPKIRCFDREGKEVSCTEGGLVRSGVAKVVSVTLGDHTQIVFEGPDSVIAEINRGPTMGEHGNLAFFFGGKADRPADLIITFRYTRCGTTRQEYPAKVMYRMEGENTIVLDSTIVLTEEAIAGLNSGECIVRQHGASGYVYPIDSFLVPATWQKYSYQLDMHPDYSLNDHRLRMGTHFFRVGFMTNYQQSEGVELVIKDFRIDLQARPALEYTPV